MAGALLHNYRRIAPNLVRGASPEKEADFAALAKAGVRSILSVDGAQPDVETAKKYGLRYVHIPFSYDGIPGDKRLELVKTFRLLAAQGGTIYVHCHHGKHRGPTASGIGLQVLGGATPEAAVADLKSAGTDPKYKGLYEAVRSFRLPSDAELKDVRADLPSIAPVPAMAEAMVHVDATWERLKLVKAADWAAPKDHPDVDPAHEARILAEHFRELARTPTVAEKPAEFRTSLSESESAAWALAKALEKGALDAKGARAAFERGAASCAACHTAFRDARPVEPASGIVPAK